MVGIGSLSCFTLYLHTRRSQTRIDLTQLDTAQDVFNWRHSTSSVRDISHLAPLLRKLKAAELHHLIYCLPHAQQSQALQHSSQEEVILRLKMLALHPRNLKFLAPDPLKPFERDPQKEQYIASLAKEAFHETEAPLEKLELYRFFSPPNASVPFTSILEASDALSPEIQRIVSSTVLMILDLQAHFDTTQQYEIRHKIQSLLEHDLRQLLVTYKGLSVDLQRDRRVDFLDTLRQITWELEEFCQIKNNHSLFEYERLSRTLQRKYQP